jgi:hypothetical protein
VSPVRVAALTVALGLAAPPAAAGPLSALAKLAKAGSSGAKAAKAAKAAKLVGTAGAAVAAERAGLVFANVGDDVGRAAAYVGRDAAGEFRLIVRGGSGDITTTNVRAVVAELPHERVDLYIDLSAARHPEALPRSTEARLYVLDVEARPHRARIQEAENGKLEALVDVGDGAMDMASWVAEQLADEPEDPEPPLSWMIGGVAVGGVGVAGWFWLRRRRQRQAALKS